jgi:hypothetical protein
MNTFVLIIKLTYTNGRLIFFSCHGGNGLHAATGTKLQDLFSDNLPLFDVIDRYCFLQTFFIEIQNSVPDIAYSVPDS